MKDTPTISPSSVRMRAMVRLVSAQRQPQGVHEQLAAFSGIGGDDRHAGHEEDLHLTFLRMPRSGGDQ
jgi:hypothetical protein